MKRASDIVWVRSANARAWVLGRPQANGFHVRKLVWGRLMARAERWAGEEIRAALIWVERGDAGQKPLSDKKTKINRVRNKARPKSTT